MPDFVPTFWNTLTQHNGRSRTSKVSAGQVAYKKRGYAWDSIVTDVESDLTATKFPGSIQFPRNAQDWLEAEFDGEYSAKRQVTEGNWQNSEDAFVMRMRADCPTNATGIIHPDKPWQVIYYNAFGQGQNLIYGHWHGRTSRLEHVIEITEMPAGDSEFLTYDFYIESEDATTFVGQNYDQRPWAGNSGDGATVQGFSVFLAKGSDPATPRGAVLRKPVCWWKNLDGTTTIKDVRVDVVIQPDRETVKATKYIRRSDIAEALAQGSPYRADATFSPDASPETSSVDGSAGRLSTESWSALRAGSGTTSDDRSSSLIKLQITLDGSGNGWGIDRPIILFDTSSIGSGNQVDSGTLQLDYGIQSDEASLSANFTSALVGSSPASNTALVDADYQTVNSTEMATGRHAYGTTGVRAFTLNAAGIANVPVDGVAKFGIREGYYDLDGNSPSGTPASFTRYHPRPAEYTGTASDPLLTVVTSAVATGSPHYYSSSIQGAI